MRVGIIDVDGHNFPNVPLMKLSGWHKKSGDSVEWYEPLIHGFPSKPMDIVYMSKVFSFSCDYPYYVNAKEVIKGGSGYCISVENGKEIFENSKHKKLPNEIEHTYPDYSIYFNKIPEVKNTAYGFLTRGCPRNCSFCHVESKEGMCSVKVANVDNFWKGQKHIVLLDPNITACNDCKDLFVQLTDSKAWVDFSQGMDIRLMDNEKIELLKKVKLKRIHFAWDNYKEKNVVVSKLKEFKGITGWNKEKMTVYILTNFNSTFEQDLERVYTVRDLGFHPYVMIYNKNELDKKHKLRKLQRWVNSKVIFETIKNFNDYKY